MLTIKNLQVEIDGRKVVKGVDLSLRRGGLIVVMGPNGSGKSSLAMALMGHPSYKLGNSKSQTLNPKQKMSLDGESLLGKTPDERAKMGLFLGMQYPVAVEGVTVEQLLRVVDSKQMGALVFRRYLEKEARRLGIKKELLKRSVNDGFSGGEKKRLEILQMEILDPKYAVLDETDSGLDIDAIKTVARGIGRRIKSNTGIILITHYQRILKYLSVDRVLVMVGGKIVERGDKSLVKILEKEGYRKITMKGAK